MRNLPVQDLGFDAIKENLKQFLKANPNYTDFNFEASGINVILNTLSYNTHYLGYFIKMLLDESFVDSAHTRQALLSHAKKTGYIPRGRKAAQAEIVLSVETTLAEEPSGKVIALERGTTFTAVNSNDDQRTFTVLDGTTLTDRTVVGSTVTYTSAPLIVHEGSIRTWKFIVDTSVVNQKFVIKDPNIDIDTIRVVVRPDEMSSSFTTYGLTADVLDLNPNDPVFYVTTDETGNYQVFFGNNIFGNQPDNGNIVEVTYISTNGPEGNGARLFNFNAPAAGGAETNIGNFEDFTVTTLSPGAGGLEPQTVDELKFSIPNHWRRQNRAVTASDFRGILTSEFRNIDSINVWGGEDHVFKDYGKIYVSIKPRFSNRLTTQARAEIKEKLIKRYGVVGTDIVFVDPEFIEVGVDINVKIDKRKTNLTNQEISNSVLNLAQEFNTTRLSKFDQFLSDVEFLNFIRGNSAYVVSIFDKKTLSKVKQHLHNSDSTDALTFSNALVPATVNSGQISYGVLTVTIKDDGLGKLYLHTDAGSTNILVGSVNYATGQLEYKLPKITKIVGYESLTHGTLVFSANPQIPDIQTTLNNIVRLGSIKVNVT